MKSVWPVFVLAALILVVELVTGKFGPRTLFALAALVLVGAIFPPVGIGMGAIVLLYLLMVGNKGVSQWFTSKIGGASNAKSN